MYLARIDLDSISSQSKIDFFTVSMPVEDERQQQLLLLELAICSYFCERGNSGDMRETVSCGVWFELPLESTTSSNG